MDETDNPYEDDPEYQRVHRADTIKYLVKTFGSPKKKKKKKPKPPVTKRIVYDYSSLLQGDPDLLEREEKIRKKRIKEHAKKCARAARRVKLLRPRD